MPIAESDRQDYSCESERNSPPVDYNEEPSNALHERYRVSYLRSRQLTQTANGIKVAAWILGVLGILLTIISLFDSSSSAPDFVLSLHFGMLISSVAVIVVGIALSRVVAGQAALLYVTTDIAVENSPLGSQEEKRALLSNDPPVGLA